MAGQLWHVRRLSLSLEFFVFLVLKSEFINWNSSNLDACMSMLIIESVVCYTWWSEGKIVGLKLYLLVVNGQIKKCHWCFHEMSHTIFKIMLSLERITSLTKHFNLFFRLNFELFNDSWLNFYIIASFIASLVLQQILSLHDFSRNDLRHFKI